MQMSIAYGIFDNEADLIIALVHQHAPIEQIRGVPCPACGSKMDVSFNKDGTEFMVNCDGDPLHFSKDQQIQAPPPWWETCYEEPTDSTWYWREWHSFDEAGTLFMKMSGWQADGVRWSGEMERQVDHPDYAFWLWLLNESGCTKDLISDTDLDELRARFHGRKSFPDSRATSWYGRITNR